MMRLLHDETKYFKTEKNPGQLSLKLSVKKMQFEGYDTQKEHVHPLRLFL